MDTLIQQIAKLVETLDIVKDLCQQIVDASVDQQTQYSAATEAQRAAGESSNAVVALAQQIIEKIGAQ